jgi:tetratricopeptide (TPR) repeat protein
MVKKKSSGKKRTGRIPSKKVKPLSSQKREPSLSRFDSERMNRVIAQIMKKHEFKDVEEMNQFLENHFISKKLDDILEEREYDPLEEAQDLAYEAMDTENPAEAIMLILEALVLNPNCIEALRLAADFTSMTDLDYIEKLEMIITRAEETMGKEYIEENKGHFWSVIETRPYMRTRADLAKILSKAGKKEEAIFEYEEMLKLNPNDNQGLRYNLLSLYLETGNLTRTRRLFKEYGYESSALFLWGRVLERYLSDKHDDARKAVLKAEKQNPYVAGYLTGKKRLPEELPYHYSPGKESEAIVCFDVLGDTWKKYPDAIKWLRSLK